MDSNDLKIFLTMILMDNTVLILKALHSTGEINLTFLSSENRV